LAGTWSVAALPLDVQGEEGYKLFTASDAERMPAQVPGEIHLDLMRAGKMEDPSVSDNARTQGRWPEEHSWWYRTEFTLPAGFREHFRQRLAFDGIDLWGQVFVNGSLVGETKNAFSAHEFDVSSLLKEGTNELVVRVTSGTELVLPGRREGCSAASTRCAISINAACCANPHTPTAGIGAILSECRHHPRRALGGADRRL